MTSLNVYLDRYNDARMEFTKLIETLSRQPCSMENSVGNILAGFQQYSIELDTVSKSLVDTFPEDGDVNLAEYRPSYLSHMEAMSEYNTIIQALQELRCARSDEMRNIILGMRLYFGKILTNMDKIHRRVDKRTPFDWAFDYSRLQRVGSIYSPAFYSSGLGFRMKGLITFQLKSVYLYIRLLSGENDCFIQFPFDQAIRVTILDRRTHSTDTENQVQTMTVDPVDEIEAKKWEKQSPFDDEEEETAWSHVAIFEESLLQKFNYSGSVIMRLEVVKPVIEQSKT